MLYCSSECASISITQLRTIYRNTHVHTFRLCLCLLALTFVCNSTYLLKCSFEKYEKSMVVFIRCSKVWFKTTWCAIGSVTRCNFPGNLQRNYTLKRSKLVTNVWYVKNFISKLWWKRVFAIFTSTKSRIALQVARKIAPCDRAFSASCCFESYLWTSNKYYNAFLIYLKWTFQ